MATPINVTGTDFLTVFVTDYPRALEFYCGLLGLEHSVDYGKIPAGEVETGDLTLQVTDAASVGQECEPRRQGETLDSGVCHMAFFSDPDGNALMLHNRYASEPT